MPTLSHPERLAPDGSTTYRADFRQRVNPRAASALTTSVEAVRDGLAHMDAGAVLSVPLGAEHEHFDVVDWCAANGKRVVNRFDPWPLTELLIENTVTP